jgi:hypothetical protein
MNIGRRIWTLPQNSFFSVLIFQLFPQEFATKKAGWVSHRISLMKVLLLNAKLTNLISNGINQ